MIISKKNNTFRFIYFTLLIIACCANTEKINFKDMQRFGVRYLDHLEYEVPIALLGDASEKNPTARFNSQWYVNALKQGYVAPVYIAFVSDEVGYGIFAAQNISRGQLIGEYTGIVKKVDFSNNIKDYDYAWGFPPPTKCIVDSKDAGNFTRFINHSDNPNVIMIYVRINKCWHLAYVANQDIKKDQQILAHYGNPYWKGRNNKPRSLAI